MAPTAVGTEQVGHGYNPADEGNTARPIGMKLHRMSLDDLGTQRKELEFRLSAAV